MAVQRSRERITKPCHNCGAPVTRLKSLDSPRWFCNHKCYTSSAEHSERIRQRTLERHPDALLTIHCDGCGKTMQRHKSKVETRERNFCSHACRQRDRVLNPTRQVNSNGYVLIYIGRGEPGASKSGHILEHRHVMAQMIGRALADDENVHHMDGDRTNNSPMNLELWSRSQPSGQRVQDKVRWARQILALYGDLFPE